MILGEQKLHRSGDQELLETSNFVSSDAVAFGIAGAGEISGGGGAFESSEAEAIRRSGAVFRSGSFGDRKL